MAPSRGEEQVSVKSGSPSDLVHDLYLPTLLFAALGGMTWAVRGCSGFGGSSGCIFAGVMWGTAWWFIAHDPSRGAVAALRLGLDRAGRDAGHRAVRGAGLDAVAELLRGQAANQLRGRASTCPIARAYGFLWLFIAGMPWAGIGACLLAWCGSQRETRAWHWAISLACGIGGAMLARYLFREYPQFFLPLYDSLEAPVPRPEAQSQSRPADQR